MGRRAARGHQYAIRRAASFPAQVRIHLLLYHGPRRLQAQVRAARRRVLRRAPDVVFVPSVWDTRWCSWWPLLLVASVILQLALYPRIHGVCELPEWALLQARVAHQARLRVLLVQARRHSHFWYRADATAKRAPRRAPCRGQLPLRVDTSRRRAELVKTLQFSLRSRGLLISPSYNTIIHDPGRVSLDLDVDRDPAAARRNHPQATQARGLSELVEPGPL